MSQQYQKQKLKWIEKGKLEEREKIKKKFMEIEKKYPEHYWRWQFFGKVLFPEEQLQKEIGGMK